MSFLMRLVINVSAVSYSGLSPKIAVNATEWLLTFSNNGTVDTPPLCAIYGVNMTFSDSTGGSVTEVRRYLGSNDSAIDYEAVNETLSGEENYVWFWPFGGRSSDGVLPFFTVFHPGGIGYTMSIGWCVPHPVAAAARHCAAVERVQNASEFLLSPYAPRIPVD